MDGIPPRLLGAIRAEVEKSSEDNLRDLWMVIHALRDGMAKDTQAGVDISDFQEDVTALREALESVEEELGRDIRETLGMVERKLQHVEQLGLELNRIENEFSDRIHQLERGRKSSDKTEENLRDLELRFDERIKELESREPAAATTASDGASSEELEALRQRLVQLENRPVPAAAAAPTPAASSTDLVRPPDLSYDLVDLLDVVINNQATDLHLKTHARPMARLNSDLVPIGKSRLTPDECKFLILSSLPPFKRERVLDGQEVEHALFTGENLFRMSVYWERASLSCSCRSISSEIPTLEDLRLPEVLESMVGRDRGLVLLCGETGSGKTTTMASLVDHINTTRKFHIITVDRRLEFLHADQRAFVCQREVGSDATEFSQAIRHATRQGPDLIAIDHLETREEIAAMLSALEAGQLVIASVVAENVVSSLKRLLARFDTKKQARVASLLADGLVCVCAQQLTLAGDEDRHPLTEILVANSSVRSCIQKGAFDGLARIMEQGELGMHSFAQCKSKLSGGGARLKMDSAPTRNSGERKAVAAEPPQAPQPTPPPRTEPTPAPAAAPPAPAPAPAPAPVAAPPTPPQAPAAATPAPAPPPPPDSDEDGEEALLGWL